MNIQPIYIVGPTASGKSNLAIEIAKKFNSIIISADSMQIYKGLDVGTAKVTLEEQKMVPHKMIDIVNYDEEFSVAEFSNLARIEIEKALNNSIIPIIVGGTGLYFESLFYPMSFSNTNKNDEYRDYLRKELDANGPEWLHKELEKVDLKSAQRIPINDTKRTIRALEIIKSTGKTLEDNKDDRKEPDVLCVGLNTDREVLYQRINERVDIMFNQGLIDEVYNVCNFNYQSMQAIGYKEFKDYPNKEQLTNNDIDNIKSLIKQHTRNYAKRQITWFKKYNFVKWFDINNINEAIDYISNIIEK